VLEELAAELGVGLSLIGEIHVGEGVRLLDADGSDVAVENAGYRHF
jgi:thiamine monophosphate kinase